MLARGRGLGIVAGVVGIGRCRLAFGAGDGFVRGVTGLGKGMLIPRSEWFAGGGALILLSGSTLATGLVAFRSGIAGVVEVADVGTATEEAGEGMVASTFSAKAIKSSSSISLNTELKLSDRLFIVGGMVPLCWFVIAVLALARGLGEGHLSVFPEDIGADSSTSTPLTGG